MIARQLADQGARIAITARTEADLNIAADELRTHGTEVISVPCDVREQEQVAAYVDRVMHQFDGVDVLINVAGIIAVGPLEGIFFPDRAVA